MRNLFYAIVSVSLLSFSLFSVVKGNAAGTEVELAKEYPYQITEYLADGTTKTHAGKSQSFKSAQIVPDLGLDYYPEDKVSFFPDPEMGIGSTLKLERVPILKVKDGKRSKDYRSWSQTVGELFTEKGIQLGNDDKVNPSLDSKIFNNSQVSITRVAITNVVETRSIDFQIIEKEDPNLNYGKKRTEAGIKGEKKLTYRVRREDGDEVERALINTEVLSQPKSQINFTGTKVTVISSVRGKATIGPSFCNIVSANYKKGTLVRITNTANGAKLIGTVDCTWGTASAPSGVVLDVSMGVMSSIKWNGSGAGPSVLVEELQQ